MIAENITEEKAEPDIAESLLHKVDTGVKSTSGISLFHILTFASIVGSIRSVPARAQARRDLRRPLAADVSGA